ncbi:MAG: NAD-dependent epimerase/dehydratase family protein [Beijerinckiaceae bacterium]
MALKRELWEAKRVLVTGHTGLIRGWLTILLHEMGAKARGYALDPPTPPSFFETVGLTRLLEGKVRADIRDQTTLVQETRAHTPEIVFHLAAQPIVSGAFRSQVKPRPSFGSAGSRFGGSMRRWRGQSVGTAPCWPATIC